MPMQIISVSAEGTTTAILWLVKRQQSSSQLPVLCIKRLHTCIALASELTNSNSKSNA
jgi:hypothetical protein